MMIKKKKYEVWEFKDDSSQYLKQLKKKGFTRYDIKGRVVERVRLQPLNNQSAKNIGTKTIYQFKNNQLQEELHYSTVDHLHQYKKYRYNNHGQLMHCIYSYADGSLIHESFYEYDRWGRKTKWICKDYSMDDKSVYRYYYDTWNRPSKTTCESNMTGLITWKYRYDGNDNLVEETEYKGDGSIIFRTFYCYTNGRKIRKEYYGREGEKIGYDTFEYDDNGNCIRLTSYNHEPTEMTEMTYNQHGDLVSAKNSKIIRKNAGVHAKFIEVDDVEYKYEYYKPLEILWRELIDIGYRALSSLRFWSI